MNGSGSSNRVLCSKQALWLHGTVQKAPCELERAFEAYREERERKWGKDPAKARLAELRREAKGSSHFASKNYPPRDSWKLTLAGGLFLQDIYDICIYYIYIYICVYIYIYIPLGAPLCKTSTLPREVEDSCAGGVGQQQVVSKIVGTTAVPYWLPQQSVVATRQQRCVLLGGFDRKVDGAGLPGGFFICLGHLFPDGDSWFAWWFFHVPRPSPPISLKRAPMPGNAPALPRVGCFSTWASAMPSMAAANAAVLVFFGGGSNRQNSIFCKELVSSPMKGANIMRWRGGEAWLHGMLGGGREVSIFGD